MNVVVHGRGRFFPPKMGLACQKRAKNSFFEIIEKFGH